MMEAPLSDHDVARPSRVGPFEVRAELGRGAMGVVYEAVQDEPRRVVALKVLHGGSFADPDAQALFRREIRALARLDHPGVATLYASGATPDGLPYFAMELVRGEPLDVWLRRRRGLAGEGETRVRLEAFLQICDAVAYAHQRGVLHRDLKPSNIVLLDAAGGASGAPLVKVLDFGLARITDSDLPAGTFATELGTVRGTLAYMSPEQLSGNPETVDVRADVYALGVVLYELLTERHPLGLEDAPAFDVPRRVLEGTPRAISRSGPGSRRVDADLATIALKALEKEPDRRYPTAQGLADDVRRYLAGQPISARPPSTAYQLRKLIRRHRGFFAVLVGVFVLVVGFAVSMAVLASYLRTERDRASREAESARTAMAALSKMLDRQIPSLGYARRIDDPETASQTIEELDREWRGDPETEVDVLKSAGLSIFESGGFAAGIRFLERAAEVDREHVGGKWAAHGIALCLGECYQRAGRLAEAEATFRQVVTLLRKWPAGLPPQTLANALEDHGCALRDLGRFDEAEPLLREAHRIYDSVPMPQPEFLASIHDSLGTYYLARGELAPAEANHREALETRRQFRAESDPHLLRSEHYLGLVLLRRGRLEEAESLLRRALAGREKALGPGHPDTGATVAVLGEVALARRNFAEARAAFDRADRTFAGRVAPEHPDAVMLRRARESLDRLAAGR